MKINIETINHKEQEYSTVGNYWVDANGTWQIRVSKMGNEFYEAMIAIHEFIEFALIRKKGLTPMQITEFDLAFEEKIKKGTNECDEPGFAKDCPYLREHTLAMAVEMQMCALAGLNFHTYNKEIDKLFDRPFIGADDKKTIAMLTH